MRKRRVAPRGLIRQGDVLLVPVGDLPEGTWELESERGRVVLATGEATGHAHVVRSSHARLVRHRRPTGRRGGMGRPIFEERDLLVVEQDALLEHEEHASIEVPAAVYEVRRQREYQPGARRTGGVWVRD
jgi:hypothetical protein